MADESEVIRHQMEETRTDISEKLETLENEFAGSVQHATDAVSETVAEVQGTMRDTVESVRETVHDTMETVKSTFDVPHQVDQHPWLMLGGAVAVGYLGGALLTSLEKPRSADYVPDYQTHLAGQELRREPSSVSKWLGEMAQTFKPEIEEVKGLAIGAALSIVRDLVSRSLAPEMRQQLAETVDHFTVKLGGKPIQGLVPEPKAAHQTREPSMAG